MLDNITMCFLLVLPLFFNIKILPSLFLYPIFQKYITFFKEKLVKNNISGKDLHKIDLPIIPESLGILPALIYLFYQLMFLPEQMHTTVLSICSVSLLGFLDDVLDLPWRIKIILPILSALPLVNSTQMMKTTILLPFEFGLVNIGIFYNIYIILLICFLANAINIYAGINGLETGQTMVIGCFSFAFAYYNESEDAMLLLAPFLVTGLGLYYQNRYPAKAFVGDVWCYYSGMVLAVSSVQGRYVKTILCLIIPIPQLFKIYPCPRHRIPKLNKETLLLEDSKNMTLINLVLRVGGPKSEKRLAEILINIQIISCIIGLGCREIAIYLLYA